MYWDVTLGKCFLCNRPVCSATPYRGFYGCSCGRQAWTFLQGTRIVKLCSDPFDSCSQTCIKGLWSRFMCSWRKLWRKSSVLRRIKTELIKRIYYNYIPTLFHLHKFQVFIVHNNIELSYVNFLKVTISLAQMHPKSGPWCQGCSRLVAGCEWVTVSECGCRVCRETRWCLVRWQLSRRAASLWHCWPCSTPAPGTFTSSRSQ